MRVLVGLLAVGALALAVVYLATAPTRPSGPVLWAADAESAVASEWASSSSLPAPSAPPKPDPSRINQNAFRAQGTKSYRFELRHGDDSYGARVELGEAMPTNSGLADRKFYAGQERWISMQYYLPTTWPMDNAWQTIFQIKPSSVNGGGPNIGIDAGFNKLKFYGNGNVWASAAGEFTDGSYPLPKGRWIKLTWHIVFSANPAVGSLELFGDLRDGHGMRTLVPRRNRATMKYLNGVMDPMHLRVGIYRSSRITTTGVMYADGITVATTRAAAEANAYRPTS